MCVIRLIVCDSVIICTFHLILFYLSFTKPLFTKYFNDQNDEYWNLLRSKGKLYPSDGISLYEYKITVIELTEKGPSRGFSQFFMDTCQIPLFIMCNNRLILVADVLITYNFVSFFINSQRTRQCVCVCCFVHEIFVN